MITIYLCDDNSIILEKYKNLLSKIAQSYHLNINIMVFQSGEQLLFHMEDSANGADIIYLDIIMGEKNGLETAKALRSNGCQAELIFLTSNPEYVFDSFDSSPTHYILKDSVTDARFQEIFFKAAAMVEKKTKALFQCVNGTVKKQIPIGQISYFEVRNRIITVHYDNSTFNFYSRMDDLETELAMKNFIRVHRSYLVHLRYIDQLSKDSLILITGETIPLGVTYNKNVKLSLARYLNLFH